MLKTQNTIQYKTYIKETLVEAMSAVFSTHPDVILRDKTQISTSLPVTRSGYPAVILRYYERDIHNLGVGHHEWHPYVDPETGEETETYVRYAHYGYSGDVEFALYGLSSYDRDVIGDAVVNVLTMGDTETYSKVFWDRIYHPDYDVDLNAADHYINLNSDRITGYGESEMIAPWMPEDVLVYQTSYRIPITGEFYSRTPTAGPFGLVSEVELYPYSPASGEEVSEGDPTNPNPWLGEGEEFF